MTKTTTATRTTGTADTCYGIVRSPNTQQEWYESASRAAGRRARALRSAGFHVTTSPMGEQVTGVGRVRMTLVNVDVRGFSGEVPAPARIERS